MSLRGETHIKQAELLMMKRWINEVEIMEQCICTERLPVGLRIAVWRVRGGSFKKRGLWNQNRL